MDERACYLQKAFSLVKSQTVAGVGYGVLVLLIIIGIGVEVKRRKKNTEIVKE